MTKKTLPKKQKEISVSLQEPYDKVRGNPNFDRNRGNEISFKKDNTKPINLGFKEIDEAIFYYMENVIKPTVIQNGKVQKVPVIYGSAERWKQMQKTGYYRDKKGALMMPFIAFKIKNIEKNRKITNKLDANSPNNYQIFTKTYSSKNIYDKFNLLNNRIPEKVYYAVVVPDYVTLTYDFIISTYYIEQMNKLIEAINYASDSYWGDPERFKFRARIDSFIPNIDLPLDKTRIVKSTFSLKLYGYVIPDNMQKSLTSIKKFNNKTKLVFTSEIVTDLNNI